MTDTPIPASTTTTTEVTPGAPGQPPKVVTKTTTISPLTQLGYWTAGVIGSFISGAAGAVSSGLGGMIVAPDKFNLGDGFHKLLQLAAFGILIPGIVSLAKYLNLHPIPQGWDGQDRRTSGPAGIPDTSWGAK